MRSVAGRRSSCEHMFVGSGPGNSSAAYTRDRDVARDARVGLHTCARVRVCIRTSHDADEADCDDADDDDGDEEEGEEEAAGVPPLTVVAVAAGACSPLLVSSRWCACGSDLAPLPPPPPPA